MRLYRIGSHPPPFCGNTPWVCVSGATQASGAEGHECSHLFLTDSRIQRSPARMFGKGLERTSAMRVCSRGTGHVIAGLTQRTGSWVATRTADTACRSKGLLHRAGIRLPGNLGHATGQFAAARLSICLCGPGRRTCQGHSGNTHILHIACRWHGQWQQDWCVRQAVVSDMREGKRAPRGRRPAIVHETQGADSSGQSRTSPAGSDDNADILYQPAGVFAPLHHDALGARHPRVHDTRCFSPRRPSWHPPHAGW